MKPAGGQTEMAVLHAEAARLGLSLDPAARERFATYLAMLHEWNPRAALTAVTESDAVQRRHFGESLALLAVLRRASLLPPGASVVDVGAGGGVTGLPMHIVDPSLQLMLLEANGRKCRFLEAVVETLALDGVTVTQARAEDAGRDPALRARFDVAVARAVAALPVLVEYALPLLAPGGVLATPKGRRFEPELAQAGGAIATLGGTAEPPIPLPLPDGVPSQTVLVVRRTGELDDRYPRRTGVPSKRPLH